ncbi:MAG TPA: type IX secretion system protein PorQ [Saprospiraceae bacterium]|nr:type IX secretion system protein PorQ [Saprospiraceae bacterium]
MKIKNRCMKAGKLIFVFLLTTLNVSAQTGRKFTYEFLSLPPSARITGLGGIAPVLRDDDINLSVYNPSNLNPAHHRSLAFNHNFHFAGISNGSAAYGHHIEKWGITTQLSVGYMSYGDFKWTTERDESLGSFTASEQYIGLGLGRRLNERITAGLQIKSVFSHLETYQSFGMAADLALQYENPDQKMAVTFLVRNLGGEISTYNASALSAPLDIQIALTKRLSHLPLRFSIIAHQLQQWDVRYDDPSAVEETDLFGEVKKESAFAAAADNFFRHFMFNMELSLGKTEGFKIRAAYNHQRRQELNLSTFRSMAGFSLGFGLKIKQIGIDYGLGYYHLAGATNHLSLVTNLDRFKRKSGS